MFYKFLILFHVCTAFPLKCPEPAQWSIRARSHCPDPSKYFCLKNDLINGYSENCTVFDFLQPGRKNVLRGGLDADICSSERYQPWPITFYTNVSTNCIFLKSVCKEEGQVIYGKGNRNIDATCRCDYKRGYDFLVRTLNPCFCIPSKEDCSCYVKTCLNATGKLSPDYKCLNDDENITVSDCKPIIYERVITAANENKTENILTRQNISYKVQRNIVICLICIGLTIAFCIGVLMIQLSLEAFLYIVEPSSDIVLIEGDTVTLVYKLLINIFPNSFSKNDQVLPLIDKISKKEDGRWIILKIKNVSLDDVGVYCLEVAGQRSSLTNLVIRRSFIEEPPRDIQLVEGQTVELKYKLLNDRLTGTFLKNDLFLPALKNIEKFVDGVWKKIKITNITQKDVGMYCLEVAEHRSRLTKVVIKQTTATDSGTYYVKAENVEMEFSVTVKAIFKRRLIDITTMEGIDTKLECETVEENCHALWFKDDEEIDLPARMTIERTQGCLHTLSLAPTSVEDSGTYSIKINGATSIGKVYIKEMPETIKRMSIQDREEFLKAAKSGITKRHTIRVMIVGEKSVGKTCLLRRLMDEEIDDVESTDGINIERRKCQIDIETGKWHFHTAGQNPHGSPDHMEQFADCGFWDFAGQREFYATHQTFLSSNAVYLLVVDISKDFTNKTYNNMIEKEFDSIGEYIDFWLDNIHCYSRDDTNTSKHHNENNLLNPPVIIVGTGIDKLPEVGKQKMEFERNVSKILSGHAKRRHLRKIHYVSNTLPSDDKQEFKSLREDIVRHAKALTTWGENLPTRWVVLEKKLTRSHRNM
ncbi:unnamed protein product [Mytilus edulis]|uniref:Roc domain-containing protein n=1 Tax=Mytilus edulis TaxID=6550 RepID=A0A8S3Q1T6_MYTED|nr:unnamed protein product [Mytilus edulis]